MKGKKIFRRETISWGEARGRTEYVLKIVAGDAEKNETFWKAE